MSKIKNYYFDEIYDVYEQPQYDDYLSYIEHEYEDQEVCSLEGYEQFISEQGEGGK